MIKVGCCGFPGGMEHYFNEFEVVEAQKTFYKLPRIETAAKWQAQAPAGFEFTHLIHCVDPFLRGAPGRRDKVL